MVWGTYRVLKYPIDSGMHPKKDVIGIENSVKDAERRLAFNDDV